MLDIERFGASCAYTVDGSDLGELQDETFSAVEVRMTITGVDEPTAPFSVIGAPSVNDVINCDRWNNDTGYLLMTTLMMSRDHTRPLGQLSKHLMVHPTTVTLAADQLEKRGLLRRTPHPTDRRTILACLTPAGMELLGKATEALADAEFGLTGVSEGLSVRLVDVLQDVRIRIGDAD